MVPGWQLMTPDSDACVKFEPEGLRLTMPLGYEKQRQGIGLASAFGVQGILRSPFASSCSVRNPEPDDTPLGSTGTACAPIRKGPVDFASLSRSVLAKQGTYFHTFRYKGNKEQNVWKQFPTKAKSGQLRMIRCGAEIYYYVAEGSSDEFVFLNKHPSTDADLNRVCLFGNTGGPKASLDVRITDLRISADSLPRLPPTASVRLWSRPRPRLGRKPG